MWGASGGDAPKMGNSTQRREMNPHPAPCLECDHRFARDPVLEVACPVCLAPVGVQCASVAPSEHRKSTLFSKLAPWGHDERDLLACSEGHYRHPCTVSEIEQQGRVQRARAKLWTMMRGPVPVPVQVELLG